MRSTIYKTQKLLFNVVLPIVAMLAVNAGGASAASSSNTYALACTTGSVTVSKNSLDCSKGPHVVTVQGIGSKSEALNAGNPYPTTANLTIVKVDCSKGTPKDPTLGDAITKFSCTDGGTAKVTVTGHQAADKSKKPAVPIYGIDGAGETTGGAGSATAPSPGDCTSNNGTCADCQGQAASSSCPGCKNGVCVDSAANPKATCSKSNCDLISKYLNPMINLLSVSFGVIAVISLVIGGIQYSASGGDPQKVAQAKKRIINTIVAIVVYLFMFSFLQFLVPGGLFNRPEVP